MRQLSNIMLALLAFLVPAGWVAADSTPPETLATVAEASGFTRTSLYDDVMELVTECDRRTGSIRVGRLATSTEGRMIPYVVVSARGLATPEEAGLYELSTVLLVANIHAGEVEGKEALQMLLRDVVRGELDEQLANQVVLLVPIFNPDGNEKLGNNRRDNGPELAGVRHNGQHLDLNRDFVKLESPEVRALVELINRWQPVLFVDMHTTNGSYHREPVTYTTVTHPNASHRLVQYMWERLFPAVATMLEERYGFDSVPYGNFLSRTDPSLGWRNRASAGRYSTNYVGLRNIFTILDEGYAHADFKTRVLSAHAFVRSILEYTHQHIGEMARLLRDEARQTREEALGDEGWVTEFEVGRLLDVTIKSYELDIQPIPEDQLDQYPPWYEGVLVERTDTLRDYTVPYLSRPVPTASILLPEVYVIPPFHHEVVAKIRAHGIVVERLEQEIRTQVEQYQISTLSTAGLPSQGHVPLHIEGHYERKEMSLPAGSYLVSLHQPLARLVPLLLEPSSEDSLLQWGFFSSWVVQQWSNRLNPYPVLRVPKLPDGVSTRLYEAKQ